MRSSVSQIGVQDIDNCGIIVDQISNRVGCVDPSSSNRPLGTGGEYFSTYATIEELIIYPTDEQAIRCLIVCQMLSNCYRDIRLFRFDEQTADVYILAGDNLQIIIPSSGNWRFVE